MGITQIVNKLYKACVLVIGTSNRAEQDPEQNKNHEKTWTGLKPGTREPLGKKDYNLHCSV